MLSASSQALLSWRPAVGTLNSFDSLPGHLKASHGGHGVRPDLLFELNGGVIAGEARGRSRRQKALFPGAETSEQRRRLLQLAV